MHIVDKKDKITLDEVIKYIEQMVEIGETYEVSTGVEEYRQLAEWFKDYKRLLEQEPFIDKIKKDIQFIKDKCLPNNIAEEYEQKGLQEALDIIDEYKVERGGEK